MICVMIMICVSCVMAASKDNSLMSVKVIPLPEDKVRIDFQFSKPLKQLPASFITQKPARLILDFINSDIQLPEDQKMKTIKLGSLNTYNIVSVGDRVRAILDLDRTVSYSGSVAGLVYRLILNGKSNELFENTKEVFITNQVVNAKHEINHLDFRGIEKQGGRVLIDVSDASIPIDVTQIGKEVVVNFLNTKITQKLMKRFDVADFHSPVQIISLQQEGKNVRMTIVNKGDYGHFVYQVNKQFMVDIFPLSADEIQQAKMKKEVFTGKRISLNFQNISKRAVLQLLADFTGINMVVSDQVTGDITLRLNDVPWDQALQIILTTQGLDKIRTGDVMLVDTKKNLDAMEESKLKSQQIIARLEPIRSDLIQINYAKASDLAVLIKDKQNSQY
jgi:type IV pilus assembly protein PilQ